LNAVDHSQRRWPQVRESSHQRHRYRREAVSKLVIKWDDGFREVAAGNLFLDRSKDRRRKQLDDLLRPSGLRRARKFDVVETRPRSMDDELRARGLVSVTLAPPSASSVQFMAVRAVPPCRRR
jgi:hypothetical protein